MFKKDKKAERTQQTLSTAELDKLAGGWGRDPHRTAGRGGGCQVCATRIGQA